MHIRQTQSAHIKNALILEDFLGKEYSINSDMQIIFNLKCHKCFPVVDDGHKYVSIAKV